MSGGGVLLLRFSHKDVKVFAQDDSSEEGARVRWERVGTRTYVDAIYKEDADRGRWWSYENPELARNCRGQIEGLSKIAVDNRRSFEYRFARGDGRHNSAVFDCYTQVFKG